LLPNPEIIEEKEPEQELSLRDIIAENYDEAEKEVTEVEAKTDKPITAQATEKVATEKQPQDVAVVDKVEAAPIDEITKLKTSAKEIDDVFAEWGDNYIKQAGVSRKEYMKNVLDIDRDLNKDPYRGIIRIAEMYGVDLTRFSQQQPQKPVETKPNDDLYIDPALDARLRPLQEKLASFEKQREQDLQAAKWQVTRQKNQADIDIFSAKNPHYSKIPENKLFPLVKHYRAENPHASNQEILKMAYDDAVWTVPQVREALLKEAEAKKVQDANAKAQSARKAGKSVTGSPSFKVSSSSQGKTLREMLLENYEAQDGRIN